ncbi:NAD(P)-dependent oxidoreductase [Herbiconiux sp. CPCC 205763]|uniref:NAD(P)-dependent oxidoreductase n=1 Tax=Herbiconiux aconitum TaxID=2970913 RepID=A0ABT2GNG8_9MICO|nr:NAD(P)-dependent oxidoreductase [Herbiconiux aconitum]MCS5717761.1 NAD(P)-dependent oxidoreductase [Herbiconiux aconitum]
MSEQPTIGWIGLGDQGGPIARAIAEGGYPLHVWSRSGRFAALEGVPYTPHATPAELGAVSDIVGLCLSEDKDNTEVLTGGGLLDALNPGTVLINFGTGLPAAAVELTRLAAARDVRVVDAPVSGGHAGAVEKQLTTIVGGDPEVVEKLRPVLETFSATIAYMGGAGAGQVGKLINNAMLMANQKNISDLLDLAVAEHVDIDALVDVLRNGTASSRALQSLGSAITTENAEHLSTLQLIDMDIFREAFDGHGPTVGVITERAISGAEDLPKLAALITR